jgi:hypothetical protein
MAGNPKYLDSNFCDGDTVKWVGEFAARQQP